MIISSQKYIDQDIVNEKIESEDFTVSYVIIEIDGENVWWIIDGHHSMVAANQSCNDPNWQHDEFMQNQIDQEIEANGLDATLEAHWVDSNYYDIETGRGLAD